MYGTYQLPSISNRYVIIRKSNVPVYDGFTVCVGGFLAGGGNVLKFILID